MYDTVIVRYGEIFLKSEFVRRKFEDALIGNIKRRIDSQRLEGNIIRKRHRLYIKTMNPERVADALGSVFGIVSLSPAKETSAELDRISELAVDIAKKKIKKGEKFAVRAERTGEHKFRSGDIEVIVGKKISEETNSIVDLENPDKTIFVEVRDELAFVFDRRIKCLGGLPYGTQGRIIALISTGIDSPVATWMMMKRGCEIIAVHFGDEKDIREIIDKLEEFSDREIKFYSVAYDEILNRISMVSEKYTCIVCKRVMLKIAEKISKMENAQGLVTGDSLGQVASQTLRNLGVIDSAVKIPVYRPLIGMDKEEIIKIGRKIGTYALSMNKVCGYVPKKPATESDLGRIEKIEKEIGLDEIVDGIDLEKWKK